jgi:hypothetical protein
MVGNASSKPGLKTPRAAAVAGILFSVLFLAALVLLLQSVQVMPTDPGAWLASDSWKVALALNLIPFAGISFLWFIGVLRDKLGEAEDQLFATVFLGSGLLFVGLFFVAASGTGAILVTHVIAPGEFPTSVAFTFARSLIYYLTSVYALKMAGVFMLTASTMILRTKFTARWCAFTGYIAAATILVGSQFITWALFLLPAWVLLVSLNILADEFRRPSESAGTHTASMQ